MNKLILLCVAIGAIPTTTHGKQPDNNHVMDEIVITAKQSKHRSLQPIQQLDATAITMKTPISLADLFTGMPSLGTRKNSRGEMVVRVRGSEERQTSIFLDGAPLSVPWDGRVDLSMLPSKIINHVSIIKSAAPVEYGVNSILGVIDLSSRTSCNQLLCDLSLNLGQDGLQTYNGVTGWQNDQWSIVGAANYHSQDDLTAVSARIIPYAPIKNGKRLNTDTKSGSFWSSISHETDLATTRLSYLVVDATKGIAPAGHLDPRIKTPRYWRYPLWRLDQATLNSHLNIGDNWQLRSTVWRQKFNQNIDQYTDSTYSDIEQQEIGEDLTTGARLVAENVSDSYGYRLVANWQKTIHLQSENKLHPAIIGSQERYQQDIYSLSSEFDIPVSDTLNMSFGLSYDHSTTPFTGGKPAQDDLSDWAANLVLAWKASDNISITSTLGRRTRFPTLRELYGAALGKFLVNPELQPETAWLSDLTFNWHPKNLPVLMSITPWFTRIDNTLSRRKVTSYGTRLDQRYNLKGSSGHGVEIQLISDITSKLKVEINGNKQRILAKQEINNSRPNILQRPDRQYSLIADYLLSNNIQVRVVVLYTSSSLDENYDGKIQRLPSSTQLNTKLFYALNNTWKAHISVNNWSNEVIMPQLGLPSHSRNIQLGLTYSAF